MERVNFRVYNAHSVTREAWRSGHCRATYFSLPLSLSTLSAVLDGKTMMVKVREGNRRWKVERLLCAKQLLMRRNRNINTGRSCEVHGWLMAPISHCVARLWAVPTLLTCDGWVLIHSLTSATPSSIQCILQCNSRGKNQGRRRESSFWMSKNLAKNWGAELRSRGCSLLLFPFIFMSFLNIAGGWN